MTCYILEHIGGAVVIRYLILTRVTPQHRLHAVTGRVGAPPPPEHEAGHAILSPSICLHMYMHALSERVITTCTPTDNCQDDKVPFPDPAQLASSTTNPNRTLWLSRLNRRNAARLINEISIEHSILLHRLTQLLALRHLILKSHHLRAFRASAILILLCPVSLPIIRFATKLESSTPITYRFLNLSSRPLSFPDS
ncbi:hypothetical protein PGT21_017394 [Puccinia graminis f. sp. tritici]|uniref:Uncharacterized protein n=1 Tax=Puccinia graminis f. sp. tritici TaxID=56615 RepID=A0A5B0RJC5_PUCGR|nr:hypothetical protein PGT21_017394 [Puccinia graminis f. sp. tritici]KAA1126081.1 hypothetical protein PGTUg99_021376 [Puccinia graminis f. sp. tritici]